jgi:hypothetical protein
VFWYNFKGIFSTDSVLITKQVILYTVQGEGDGTASANVNQPWARSGCFKNKTENFSAQTANFFSGFSNAQEVDPLPLYGDFPDASTNFLISKKIGA